MCVKLKAKSFRSLTGFLEYGLFEWYNLQSILNKMVLTHKHIFENQIKAVHWQNMKKNNF